MHLRRCMRGLRLLLLLSARAGIAIDTMTGTVIEKVRNGRSIITMNASGTMLGLITTGIAVTGTMVVMAMGRTMAGTMTIQTATRIMNIDRRDAGKA
jgi:hypothetical protein